MGLFQSVVDNTPDRHNVTANERYEVVVTKASFGSTKGQEETDEQKGKPQRPKISFILTLPDDPLANIIFHEIYFPVDTDPDRSVQAMSEGVAGTLKGLSYNPETHGDVDPTTFVPGMTDAELPLFKGMRGWIVAGVEERQDGSEQNTVKRWVAPEKK